MELEKVAIRERRYTRCDDKSKKKYLRKEPVLCIDIFCYMASSKQPRSTKSCVVIGHPSGQDSAVLSSRDNPLCPGRKNYPKITLRGVLLNYRFREVAKGLPLKGDI